MTCVRCADLCQAVPIRSPSELEKVIRIVGANLEDGTLLEVIGDTATIDVIEPTSFAELAGSGPRPDVIKADFRCTQCGEPFRLRCETYHGSGGEWSYGKVPVR